MTRLAAAFGLIGRWEYKLCPEFEQEVVELGRERKPEKFRG